MSKHVLNRWMPTTIGELRTALDEITTDVACEGGDIETVHVDVWDLALVSETLTDGSVAFNIVVRANR